MYYNGHRLQAYQVTRSEQMISAFSPLTSSPATFDYHQLRMKVCHNILYLIVFNLHSCMDSSVGCYELLKYPSLLEWPVYILIIVYASTIHFCQCHVVLIYDELD